MRVVTVPLGFPARLTFSITVGCLLVARVAMAFPVTDPANPGITVTVPEVTESDLRHQLQMQSPFGAAAAGGGWTFVPSITLQEAYTDNVLNSTVGRRWDLITVATPGIAIQGDVPNAQVLFYYAPQFRLDARTPSQDNVSQQLVGTGLFTIVPDAFYVDARAIAGGAPVGGGFGAVGLSQPSSLGSPLSGLGTIGLSKQDQVQASSLSIAPYVLHRFDDIGTGKIGYQFNQSSFAQGNSVIPLFFPTGNNATHTTTNEGIVQFESGERFAPFRDLILADARIGNSNGVTGYSSQYVVSNRLGYLVTPNITVYGEIGYENLRIGGLPPTRIDDPIWGVGTTVTPNPDSTITVGFGHRYGENNFLFNGSYALTARTRIYANYITGLQSDLQGLQGQLDLLGLDSLGQTVDAQTGAPLFIGNGGLGIQSGLFRTKAFTVTGSTLLDRDQISVSLQLNQSTTIAVAAPGQFVPFGVPAPPVGSTGQATTVYFNWVHQVREALSLYASAAYGTSHFSNSGNQQSVAVSVALQYLISETLAVTARYAFFDRIASTPLQSVPSTQGQSFYQNLVLVGISKQF